MENWEPVLEVSLYVCLNVRKIMFWDLFIFYTMSSENVTMHE